MPVRTETHAHNAVCVSTKRELEFSRGDVPHRRRKLTVRHCAERCTWSTFSREHCSIRTESECFLRAGQTTYGDSLITIETPNDCFLVSRLGREVILIGTERDFTHCRSVTPKNSDSFARRHFPHTHRVVVAHADEIVAIRTKHGTMHLRIMPAQLPHERSGGAVPKPHHAIDARSCDQLAVGAESGRVAGIVLTQQANHLLRVRVPQSHLVVH